MIRRVPKSNRGNAAMKRPRAKRITDLRTMCARSWLLESPRWRRLPKEKGMATPTIKRKKGKMRSVGVHPCHWACRRGAQT
jgi:hypothetical protein